jgi:outer membrane immunogenic protein
MIRSFVGAMALVAAAAVATPAAAADFTGPRVGVNVGIAGDDALSTDVKTYGVNVGYDLKVGDAIVGATAEYQDGFENNVPRDLSATARLGTKVADNALIYATGGYTALALDGQHENGYRFGAGAELAVTKNVSLGVEQRYSNYGHGLDVFQTVAGLTVRF